LPAVPVLAVGGGQVLLQVSVTSEGSVRGVAPLRVTAPFTDALIEAVRTWRFQPAHEIVRGQRRATDAQVLVVGIFRPPTLNTPTLGELPRDVASAAEAVPFPLSIGTPPFPPLARDDGLVFIEVEVGTDGRVTSSQVLRSAPPFDTVALEEVRRWSFRPARVRGAPVSTVAYVVVAFRQPVTGPPKVPPVGTDGLPRTVGGRPSDSR
jgi:TonB family protein